jgi:hypothetical protein
MRRLILIFLILVSMPLSFFGQGHDPLRGNLNNTGNNPFGNSTRSNQRGNRNNMQEEEKAPDIKQEVKNWMMIDDYTLADTIAVDTLTTGVQIHNPIYRKSISNITTGNLGAPYISEIITDRQWRNDFIFYNSLQHWFPVEQDIKYFNTRTPYTNIYYNFGSPKRRSEESIGVLFTQNVNKDFNIGLQYDLFSSAGRYESQKARNQQVKLFGSYTGERYSVNSFITFNQIKQSENGGIFNDDFLLDKDKYGFEQPENIPVNFSSAGTKINNLTIFLNQSFGLGNVAKKRKPEEAVNDSLLVLNDSINNSDLSDSIKMNVNRQNEEIVLEEPDVIPVSTVFYTLKYEHDNRVYGVDELAQYMPPVVDPPYYPNIYVDSLQTRDSVRYNKIVNTFQIRINEEANTLLRFGMRAFISNEIKFYQMPAAPYYEPGDREYVPHYRSQDTTLVTSYLGGQIFKNRGENFWWNAGIKFYFQGYKVGDTELTGKMNSRFKVSKKDTAGVFADGGLYITSPELFQNKYFSNHFQWNNDFNAQKTIRLRGGIRIPTRRLEFSTEFRTINDYIYWNNEAMPDQSGDFIQVISVSANKHFIWARVHSINKLVYQKTSNSSVLPLPEFTAYSSNYYENVLFKVLKFQIGVDLRYHTKYYAPTYMPATGQFHTQNIRKIGNYPFFDVFVNFHLKRARIYVKGDHVNAGFMGNDYFYTVGYPANPISVKFGVSWNFYN